MKLEDFVAAMAPTAASAASRRSPRLRLFVLFPRSLKWKLTSLRNTQLQLLRSPSRLMLLHALATSDMAGGERLPTRWRGRLEQCGDRCVLLCIQTRADWVNTATMIADCCAKSMKPSWHRRHVKTNLGLEGCLKSSQLWHPQLRAQPPGEIPACVYLFFFPGHSSES